MIYELVYTSARRGLKTGSHGFCTVARTDGMPTAHVQLAESLSGYRNLYQPHDSNYARNPVAYSHYVTTLSGEEVSVLSRVAAYGTDYSGRTNKLAHHVMIPSAERPRGGPGSLVLDPSFFLSEWKEEPRLLAPGKPLPAAEEASYVAEHWRAACGDAGWAGVLAQAFLDAPGKDSYVVFSPGTELLPLLCETLRLLPPGKRWQVTFSTYFTSCPRTSTCLWRCCLSGSDAHRSLRSRRDALVIDLAHEAGALPSEGELVECARTGRAPAWAAAKKPRPSVRRLPRGVAAATEAEEEEPEHEPLAKPVPRKKAVVKRSGLARGRRRPARAQTTGTPVAAILAGVALSVALCGVGGWLLFVRRRPPAPRRPALPEQPVAPDTPAREPDVAADASVPDAGEAPPTGAVAGTPLQNPEDTPPVREPDEPATPEWDVPEGAELLVRTRAMRSASPPWRIELPSWEDWGTSTYAFYGRREPLALDPPTKDMDRLKGLVRGMVYELSPLGLRASIAQGKVVVERMPGAGEGGESILHGVRVSHEARTDRLVWLRAIDIRDGRLRDRPGGAEVRVPLDATLALLSGALQTDEVTCMAGFAGTELRRPIPYEALAEGDELAIVLELDENERVRIRTVIAWKQGQEPAARPVAPKPVPAEHLLDYDKLSALTKSIRLNAPNTMSLISPVKRKLVARELRALIVDHCEVPLARAGAGHPEAARVNGCLEALGGFVAAKMSGRSSGYGQSDGDSRLGGDGMGEAVRRSAADRATFFQGAFLPSNRRLTSTALYEIVHSDELSVLVRPPAASPAGDFVVEDEPAVPQQQDDKIVISELTFHPRGASWESLLTVRFVECDPL